MHPKVNGCASHAHAISSYHFQSEMRERGNSSIDSTTVLGRVAQPIFLRCNSRHEIGSPRKHRRFTSLIEVKIQEERAHALR